MTSTTAATGAAKKNPSAIHGNYGAAFNQRMVFTLCHAGIVSYCVYYMFNKAGFNANGELSGFGDYVKALVSGTFLRQTMVSGAAIGYFARTVYANFKLQQRVLTWAEVGQVVPFLAFVHGTMVYATGLAPSIEEAGQKSQWGSVTPMIGSQLYVIGSFLNTFSEFQRMVWKQDPKNKGRLYTKGLFRHSMHINYFGDILLFTGYAMMSGKWWSQVVPFIMGLGFVMQHIPDLDAYLEHRYPEDFKWYRDTGVAKLVPGIY